MTSDATLYLISNGTATGASFYWPGGRGTFMADATFAGGTVKLQVQMPSLTTSTWIDVGTECTLTAAGLGNFELPPCNLRAFVSGSPTGIYAVAAGTRID